MRGILHTGKDTGVFSCVNRERETTVKFGLFSMNSYACSSPEAAVEIAQLAGSAGFESLWAGEHVVLPDPMVSPPGMAPSDRILDPVIALTYLSAHTHRVLLGTGIIILPQRNPLVLAKELASLDELSSGRLIFGVGAGYLEPEFRALGIPFRDRGSRTNDYLSAIRAIWNQPQPAYHGRFLSFEHVQAHPRPQRSIPVVVGGHTRYAYRRAVEQATGWYGFEIGFKGAARSITESLAGIADALKRYNRPQELGKLEISITPPPGPITLERARQYADLGVDRLIIWPTDGTSATDLRALVSLIGDTVMGRV
jgi:probable F420-dependent oxidoreductase